MNSIRLEIPALCHQQAYEQMIMRWEASGQKIAPQLLSRYSGRLGKNVSYSTWLEWCEDDRTTGAALSIGFPARYIFL